MIVADIMSKQVHTVAPQQTLADIQVIFSSANYRHLLVEEDSLLQGIISDRDVLAHLSPFLGTSEERESDKKLLDLQARDIMSAPLVTVTPNTLVDSAAILLLEHPLSALPVVTTQHEIVGILSWKDILQYHIYGVHRTPVV